MTTFELISVIVAITALVASIITVAFSGIQTRRATQALLLQQQIERGNAVIHFTSRFFDLVKEGGTFRQFDNPDWAYQFWSLHATEFYFFQYGILPTFMYSLWMIDLASLYSGNDGQFIRETHTKYLNTYSFNYPDMIFFFNEIYELARTAGDENLRNRKVAEFVTTWITENRKSILA